MASVKVFKMDGSQNGELQLKSPIFAMEYNEHLIHESVVATMANRRQGTKGSLLMSEVRGGGKKPWRQKGTGRARQGSTRSPQWKHGGIAHGPKPRDYTLSLNKKVRRIAAVSALSSKVQAGEAIVIDSIKTDEYRTKTMVNMLSAVGAKKKTLVVLPEVDMKVIRSMSNIPGVKTVQAHMVSVYDILNCDTFIMAKASAEKIEEVYA